MKAWKITGIILCILGLACLGMSYYIKEQVAGGKEKIEAAQNAVKKSEQVFALNPVSKEVGNVFTKSAKQQISQGQADIIYYARLATILQIGGIIAIIVGIIMFFIPKRK